MDVVLVEDEPLVREVVAETLDAAGLDVAAAGSAEAALAALGVAPDGGGALAGRDAVPPPPPRPPPPRFLPPPVLVTDVGLSLAGGAMDGFALAAALRRRWPALGVVVMTGQPAFIPRCAWLAPRERHFLKPVAPDALVRAVRELAAEPSAAGWGR
jgi:CheY-like chemotaxis protein